MEGGVGTLGQTGKIINEAIALLGDSFIRWVHDNDGRRDLIQTVTLTSTGLPRNTYEECLDHPELTNLDPSDRKFIGVANAHGDRAPILQATDSKWWGWRKALAECGIAVEFLCPKEIKETYRRKMGHQEQISESGERARST